MGFRNCGWLQAPTPHPPCPANAMATSEWLMLAAIEGPDQLSDEMADEVVDRFRDWPGKERHIPM
jgi:hypothetical protein